MVRFVILVTFALCLLAVNAYTNNELDELWITFLKVHDKEYATNKTESAFRFVAFPCVDWRKTILQKRNYEMSNIVHIN